MSSTILYYNGQIHSSGTSAPADWILCSGGRVLARGNKNNRPTTDFLANLISIDLNKHCLLPAFSDAHTHLFATAKLETQVNLHGAASLSVALQRLSAARNRFAKGEWVLGGGYNRNVWKDGKPSRQQLDDIFPNNPVALISKDFHCLWVNSVALRLVGITNTGPHVSGGFIERLKDGTPTGLVYEQAMELINNKITFPEIEHMESALRNTSRRFLAAGISAVHSMEGLQELDMLQQINARHPMPLRVHFYVPIPQAERLIASGIRSGFGSERLSIAGVKIFTDGSLGSQTAYMAEPYEGSDSYGVSHISPEELTHEIARYNRAGLATAVHAIGDRALRNTVDAFAQVAGQGVGKGLPNRIEHAQLIPAEMVAEIKRLQLTVSAQPIHIADDVYVAEKYWGARCSRAYPFRDLLDNGVNLAFGSDTPVADFNPFKGIYCALERKYRLKPDEPVWHPSQVIALDEAIRAYTVGAARALGRSETRPALEVGSPADFIILDRNIYKVDVAEIPDVQVLATVVDGKIEYRQSEGLFRE